LFTENKQSEICFWNHETNDLSVIAGSWKEFVDGCGDGNIHFNVTPPPGMDQDSFVEGEGLKVTEAIHDLVTSLNGSISAEHGIGKLKREELARRKSAVEMDLMRAVKKALDPDNRMNPGRVL
jgi:FAD/FMN-containing dehydrogenase